MSKITEKTTETIFFSYILQSEGLIEKLSARAEDFKRSSQQMLEELEEHLKAADRLGLTKKEYVALQKTSAIPPEGFNLELARQIRVWTETAKKLIVATDASFSPSISRERKALVAKRQLIHCGTTEYPGRIDLRNIVKLRDLINAGEISSEQISNLIERGIIKERILFVIPELKEGKISAHSMDIIQKDLEWARKFDQYIYDLDGLLSELESRFAEVLDEIKRRRNYEITITLRLNQIMGVEFRKQYSQVLDSQLTGKKKTSDRLTLLESPETVHQVQASITQSSDSSPAKRGRGRPRKSSFLATKAPVGHSSSKKKTFSSVGATEPSAPRRGRPPGSKNKFKKSDMKND